MIAFTFVQIKNLIIFFYNIFLVLYKLAVNISALWNSKAKKWVAGRKNIFKKIGSEVSSTRDRKDGLVWIHCSSLGEFEQGKPVIEKIKDQYNCRILLTFFSPSGYEAKKNYTAADRIFYLPMDSKKNARKFVETINPSLIIFIKYDYWYYYLNEIKKRKISCLLVSAVFRQDQIFFKWYGSLQRKMLRCFTRIFVQNEESKTLLESIGINNITTSGDTRFDTVIETAERFQPITIIEDFIENKKCIVAGSTWKEDEEALQKVFAKLSDRDLKLIIAPHEIDDPHLNEIKRCFPFSIKFSELNAGKKYSPNVLIIDNIGMLSRLYKYAYITYVGGGFTSDGVHNVLEAAVFRKPVVFGKNYKKYKEAIELVECEGAKSFTDDNELYQILVTLLDDETDYKQKCDASIKYVWENGGATTKILNYVAENRLLTS